MISDAQARILRAAMKQPGISRPKKRQKSPQPKVFEGRVILHKEDAGQALVSDSIVTVDDPRGHSGPHVRLMSWSDSASPEDNAWLQSLKGKRVRVTVEVLPPKRKK